MAKDTKEASVFLGNLLPLTFGRVSITLKEKENGFGGMISPTGLLAYVQNLVLDSEEKL